MASGRAGLKLVLVLLTVCGTLASQSAWVQPAHTHGRAPERCCAACHAGHLPLLEAIQIAQPLLAVPIYWLQLCNECQDQKDGSALFDLSRAPPFFAAV